MTFCSISKEGNSNRILYWRLFGGVLSISEQPEKINVVYIIVQKNIFKFEVIVEIIDQMSLTSV
jgi:hypothetical protein